MKSPPLSLSPLCRTREKIKEKSWAQYYKDFGRGMQVIRTNTFRRLIKYGIPNRLRSEIWEIW